MRWLCAVTGLAVGVILASALRPRSTERRELAPFMSVGLDPIIGRAIVNTRRVSSAMVALTGYSKGHISDIIHGRRRASGRFVMAMLEAMALDDEQRRAVASSGPCARIQQEDAAGR
jgi:hypothetical protein